MRMFPLILTHHDIDLILSGFPRSVPWDMVEPHRSAAMSNHGQTLERLAERGGLCITEMRAVMGGHGWRAIRTFGWTEKNSAPWLLEQVEKWTREHQGCPMEPKVEDNKPQQAAPDHIMQFFAHEHLPPKLRAVSEPFSALAHLVVSTLPRNPERTVALRKLLEAKDAAVRASLAVG